MTASPAVNGGRYWCAVCRSRYPDAGACSVHPDEPLLDLGDEEVWLMLDEHDQRAKWQRLAMIGGVTAGLVMVITVATMFALDAWIGWTPNPIRLGLILGLGASLAGVALFMPKPTVPPLPDAEKQALIAGQSGAHDSAPPA